MEQALSATPAAVFRYTRVQLAAVAVALMAILLLFQNTFSFLFEAWHREEYSHGFLVPVITGWLLWQRRAQIAEAQFRPSYAGVVLVAIGLGVYFLGAVASITTVDAYALVIVLLGVALALMGWPAFKIVGVPLALLFLMNPIPNFFYNNLSSQLQLISSQLGVAFMRLFGVSVFLEGNVIDLGSYKLQVAEACSGLRYLFPLMTLGVLMAYLFKGRTWMRWVVFLSTIPITVLMNSLRIGIIGILVDRFGIAQAEGFLHQAEGWVIFIVCLLVLIAELWLLLRLSGDRRPLRALFAPDPPVLREGVTEVHGRRLGAPVAMSLVLLLAAVMPARALPKRVEIRPARADFTQFPLQVDAWHGQRQRLEPVYLDALKLDDYVLADYVPVAPAQLPTPGAPVNLYVAYYASQRTGQSAHSPRSCLPGGGWRIGEFSVHEVPGVQSNGAPLRVNRVIVQQGTDRQLVYYWFQERGRDITSEYLVKWYLLRDAMIRNRTDGALVRLITPLRASEPQSAGDARLAQFAAEAVPLLPDYLPN